MTSPTCSQCRCFRQFYGERQGECWGSMPQMTASGSQTPDKPTLVKAARPACAHIVLLPDGAETLVKGKLSPDTPGDAIKQAHRLAVVNDAPTLPAVPAEVVKRFEQPATQRRGRK